MAYAYHRQGNLVFDAAKLSPELAGSPLGWWRLVATLVVHGSAQVFACAMVILLVLSSGWRSERAFGAGGALLVFVLGGAAGNLVRCWEPADWLEHAGTGGLTGAFALAAAAASAAVRLREKDAVRSLVSTVVSSAITLFMCLLDAAGTDPLVVFRTVLPGILVAFVSGGILGALLPLRARKPHPGPRLAVLGLALALSGSGALGFARAIWPDAMPRAIAPPGGSRPIRKEADPWAMVRTYDEKLGLELGVPRSFRKVSLPEDFVKSFKGRAVAYQAAYQAVAFDICAFPRGEYDSPDTVAALIGQMWCQQNPCVGYLGRGEGWINGCPLGKAYRIALKDATEGRELAVWIAVISNESTNVRLCVRASLDDEDAPQLLEALARSLKVRAGSADK
ncbi:rhomboid family intramembrane serine protease [bacterium]|nr:rhomboid family intramembrane serine protease [bacterium]